MQLNPFKEVNRKIEKLNAQIDELEDQLSDALQEAKEAHQRADLIQLRVKQLEHYLGHRKHTFPKGEKRWGFNQVQTDVANGQKPKQLDNRRLKRAA